MPVKFPSWGAVCAPAVLLCISLWHFHRGDGCLLAPTAVSALVPIAAVGISPGTPAAARQGCGARSCVIIGNFYLFSGLNTCSSQPVSLAEVLQPLSIPVSSSGPLQSHIPAGRDPSSLQTGPGPLWLCLCAPGSVPGATAIARPHITCLSCETLRTWR